MKADRLLKLADFLDTVPRKAFNITHWVSNDADKPEGKRPGDCGFAGCAVGWAAHAKLFRGFAIEADYPIYRGHTGFHALDKLFGFKGDVMNWASEEAKYLFTGEHYPAAPAVTPKQVAKRIRKFVAEKSPSGA